MYNEHFSEEIQKGIAAAEQGHFEIALVYFEKGAAQGESPVLLSYLGYCRAQVNRSLQGGAALCRAALQKDPNNPLHYLNLGRILLLAGQKEQAIAVLRQGLKRQSSPQIVRELRRLGIRQQPVLALFPRNSLVNKYLGLLLARLGWR